MPKTVFDVLTERIDEDIASAKEFLAGGGPKDFPAYKEVVGLIRGLEAGAKHIADLSRNYMDDNDD